MSENPSYIPDINVKELHAEVTRLIDLAKLDACENMGAVNWGYVSVHDIQYRLSMMSPENGPHCVVVIGGASSSCGLPAFLYRRIDNIRFSNVAFECEW